MPLCTRDNCLLSVVAPLWIQFISAIDRTRGIEGDMQKVHMHTTRANIEAYVTNLRKKETEMQEKVDNLTEEAKKRMLAKDR